MVGAGWLEIFRTSDYLGIIVFFIKEMDSACPNYPYILASYLSLINLSHSSIMSTYSTSQTNVGNQRANLKAVALLESESQGYENDEMGTSRQGNGALVSGEVLKNSRLLQIRDNCMRITS